MENVKENFFTKIFKREKKYKTPKENRIYRPSAFAIVFCVLLALYTISIIFPLLVSLNVSISPEMQITQLGGLNPFWNHTWINKSGVVVDFYQTNPFNINGTENVAYFPHIFQNYVNVFSRLTVTRSGTYMLNGIKYGRENITANFWMMLFNTFAYSLGGSLSYVICCTIMAYLCAKYRNIFSKFIYALVLFMMMVPIIGAQSATIEFMKRIHLYDTYYGFLFFKFSFGGAYFLTLHAFFEDVPDAFNEAAEIDGASQLRVMVTIVIPLSVKILTTIALLQFVGFYNEYSTALLYMPTHPTLAYGVFLSQNNSLRQLTCLPGRMAAIMILAIPMFTLFMFAREKLMGNMNVGGVKG